MRNSMDIYTTDVSVKTFLDHIERKLQEKGITVFSRINHAEAARQVGLSLADEEVIIFGDPRVGTALMQENPAIGIELPLKILAWQENKKTKICFQNMKTLGDTFTLQNTSDRLEKLGDSLKALVISSIKELS